MPQKTVENQVKAPLMSKYKIDLPTAWTDENTKALLKKLKLPAIAVGAIIAITIIAKRK